MHAPSIAQLAKKKAEKAAKEVLEVARKELKCIGKIIKEWMATTRKKTMRSYFQSSRGAGARQCLLLVFHGSLPEVPSVKPNLQEEYPSHDNVGRLIGNMQTISVSLDTVCIPSSSSRSGDTVVFRAKSPLMTISEDCEEPNNSNLVEVPNNLEGSSDNSNFQSPLLKRGGTNCSKSSTSPSNAQRRYDHHRKFQTIWATKLPWAEGIMATNGILHIVKCKVYSAIDRKPCVTSIFVML